MATIKIERKAEINGDKVIVDSNVVDELSIGEFREFYNSVQAKIDEYKTEVKKAESKVEEMNNKLQGKEMHLLNRVKDDVKNLIVKENEEKKIKFLNGEIERLKSEIKGVSVTYEDLTNKEMEKRKKED